MKIKLYNESLFRYDGLNSPYLYPRYGLGELPQVWGGGEGRRREFVSPRWMDGRMDGWTGGWGVMLCAAKLQRVRGDEGRGTGGGNGGNQQRVLRQRHPQPQLLHA
eukprot:39071-Chlamydomonas_euryale.AAC.1